MSESPLLAVIGGSGLYEFPGLRDIEEKDIRTPFGDPSSKVVLGTLEGKKVAFLARHGIGHFIPPTEVNYRANIYALKSLGVTRIISISASGSLREDFTPGDLVVPDQLFDFTKDRKRSFFETGLVSHIGVADPFCGELSKSLFEAVQTVTPQVHMGGTFITIEGPRFSTRAESNIYRSWGMSLIGMTTSPEAFLAREAEICYSVLAHVTDYDVWHISEEPVTAEMVFAIVSKNMELAQEAIRNLVKTLPDDRDCGCQHALKSALSTSPRAITPAARERLALLISKYLE